MRSVWANIRRVWAICGTIAFIVFTTWALLAYRATATAHAALKGSSEVAVARGEGYRIFEPTAIALWHPGYRRRCSETGGQPREPAGPCAAGENRWGQSLAVRLLRLSARRLARDDYAEAQQRLTLDAVIAALTGVAAVRRPVRADSRRAAVI